MFVSDVDTDFVKSGTENLHLTEMCQMHTDKRIDWSSVRTCTRTGTVGYSVSLESKNPCVPAV
jgi:hypothetical protein